MKSGFAHFDDSHRENFCAAVLLLTMEVEGQVKERPGDRQSFSLKSKRPSRSSAFATPGDDPEAIVRRCPDASASAGTAASQLPQAFHPGSTNVPHCVQCIGSHPTPSADKKTGTLREETPLGNARAR
jgi:hypothetical protein